MKYNLAAAFKLLLLSISLIIFASGLQAQKVPFKVLVVASPDPDHGTMIIASRALFEKIVACVFAKGMPAAYNKWLCRMSPSGRN